MLLIFTFKLREVYTKFQGLMLFGSLEGGKNIKPREIRQREIQIRLIPVESAQLLTTNRHYLELCQHFGRHFLNIIQNIILAYALVSVTQFLVLLDQGLFFR